jgi:uncharacterized protein
MSKDLKYGVLLDFYGFSLTEKQIEVLGMYYNEDMSLSEIAEETGITRQAALDFIKRGSEKLSKLETELKLNEKFSVVSRALHEAKHFAENNNNQPLTQMLIDALKVWEEA